jgi:hypothetical protein
MPCALLIAALSLCSAGPLGLGQPPDNATRVTIGVYVNRIFEVSLKENKLSVDFYIWFRWKGDELKPHETFEVVNGKIEDKEVIGEVKKVGGENYISARVTATITKFWDITDYPLDNHEVTIEIEDGDNEADKLRFIADGQNSSVNSNVQIPGWNLRQNAAMVISNSYSTNYGDTSLPTGNASTYSRFVFRMAMERPGYGYFAKLFFGLFVAVLIAFIVFFIKPTDVDPRFGLGVGAIFAAVASQYITMSNLPDSNVLTMADKLHILAFAFIFISIVESVVSLRLLQAEHERTQRRLDRLCFVLFLAAYLISACMVVWWR